MQEHRYGAKRQGIVARGEIGGGGTFRNVEFAVVDKTPMARGRIHVSEDGEIDAINVDAAVDQRAHDLVITAGKSERQSLRHKSPSGPGRGFPEPPRFFQTVAAPDNVQVGTQQYQIVAVNIPRLRLVNIEGCKRRGGEGKGPPQRD